MVPESGGTGGRESTVQPWNIDQNGWGVPQDATESVKWYRKAAVQGSAAAQYNLGFMYLNGTGVPQDYAEAEKWYRKAAEQGDVDALQILGLAYYLGKWVPQDSCNRISGSVWPHRGPLAMNTSKPPPLSPGGKIVDSREAQGGPAQGEGMGEITPEEITLLILPEY